MRWPWRRHRECNDRADKALEESREQRKAAEREGVEIRTLAEQLRRIREANHFADSIRNALGEGR